MRVKKTLVLACATIFLNFILLLIIKAEDLFLSRVLYCLGFVTICLYLGCLIRESRAFLYSSYILFFYFGFLLVSAASAEAGAYMLEAGKYGAINGAALVVATFFIVCLETGRITYAWVEKLSKNLDYPKFPKSLEISVVFIILVLALVFCGFVFFRYSGSMLLGVERADYLSMVVPAWVVVVKSLLLQGFFICVTAYLMLGASMAKKLIGFGLLGIILSLIVIFGEKFSALNLCVMFLFIALAGAAPDFKFSRRILFLCASMFVCALSLVVYNYISLGRDASFVFTRIVLQAQVIWTVMEAPLNTIFQGAGSDCFFGCEGFKTGAQYLDYLVLPEVVYEYYQRSGTSLSGYFPAVLIHEYGIFLALIAAVVGSFFLAAVQAFVVMAIRKGSLLFSFMLFKIYYMILAFVYFGQVGVFNEVVAVCVLLGIVMILVSQIKRNESPKALAEG